MTKWENIREWIGRISIVGAISCAVAFVMLMTYAFAGAIYGKTTFYGDVEVGTYSAMTNLTAATTNTGNYLSGTRSFWYRMCGTNLLGRLPLATNYTAVSFTGSTLTNAVYLSWPQYSSVAAYVVLKSDNAGTSWVWTTVSPLYTNFYDNGTITWSNTDFSAQYAAIPTPTVPWIASTTGVSQAEFAASNAAIWAAFQSTNSAVQTQLTAKVSFPEATNIANGALSAVTLDFATSNGATTARAITVGGVTVPSATIVDQYREPQIPMTMTTGLYEFSDTFTAGKNGTLLQYHTYLQYGTGIAVSNYIRAGRGTTGAILQLVETNLVAGWPAVEFSVPMVAGQEYTYHVWAPTVPEIINGPIFPLLRAYPGDPWSELKPCFTTKVSVAAQTVTPGAGSLQLDNLSVNGTPLRTPQGVLLSSNVLMNFGFYGGVPGVYFVEGATTNWLLFD